MKIANRNAIAVSERSPPESSEMRFTRLRPGLASISIPEPSGFAGSVRTRRPSPPGNSSATSRSNCGRHVGEARRERLRDLAVDLRDDLEEVAAGLPHVVELALHEVVPFLDGLELAGGEQVHPPEEREPALDELLLFARGSRPSRPR